MSSPSFPTDKIQGRWTLPPLILHPFSEDDSPDEILEGSKASLMLHGVMPGNGKDHEQLQKVMLRGRTREVRMLFFLGRDLLRWIDQCIDLVGRTPELEKCGIKAQSFASFLVENPPQTLTKKLQTWGVTDQKSVFSRAIAITGILMDPPSAEAMTPLFLVNYHRFLDYTFACFQNLDPFTEVGPDNFDVEMYASAEYSQMLSDQWDKE